MAAKRVPDSLRIMIVFLVRAWQNLMIVLCRLENQGGNYIANTEPVRLTTLSTRTVKTLLLAEER